MTHFLATHDLRSDEASKSLLPIACQIRKTIFTMSKSRTAAEAGSRAAGPDGPDDDGWTIPRMILRGGAVTAPAEPATTLVEPDGIEPTT